jgi:DNA polymerase/3'-5' exonuclease PolX
MLLQELKEQVSKLPASDRLALVSAIIESLQSLQEDAPISETERSGAIRRMRGLLKTEQPASTDEEVAAMLEERRAENYLQ